MHTLLPPPTYSNLLPSNQGQTRGNSYFRFRRKSCALSRGSARIIGQSARKTLFPFKSPTPRFGTPQIFFFFFSATITFISWCNSPWAVAFFHFLFCRPFHPNVFFSFVCVCQASVVAVFFCSVFFIDSAGQFRSSFVVSLF